MKQLIFLCIGLLFSVSIFSQTDSAFIRKVYDEALLRGKSHEDLRQLCKDIGARLSGSAEAQMAVEF